MTTQLGIETLNSEVGHLPSASLPLADTDVFEVTQKGVTARVRKGDLIGTGATGGPDLAALIAEALYFRDFRDGNLSMTEYKTYSAVPVTAIPQKHFGLPLRNLPDFPGDAVTLELNNLTNMNNATFFIASAINDNDLSWVTGTSTSKPVYYTQLSIWMDYYEKQTFKSYTGLYIYSLAASTWSAGHGFKAISKIYNGSPNSSFSAEQGILSNAQDVELYTVEGRQAQTNTPFNQNTMFNSHRKDGVNSYVVKDFSGLAGQVHHVQVEPDTTIQPGKLLIALNGYFGTFASPIIDTFYESTTRPAGHVLAMGVWERELTGEEKSFLLSALGVG